MKKLVLLGLLCGFSAQAAGEIGSHGGSFDTSDPSVFYIRVKNGESSTVANGTFMKFSATADDGVTVLKTTTQDEPATCVMDESCAASAFCRCQTYGYKSSVLVDGVQSNISAGGRLSISHADGRADGSASAGAVFVGIAADASSASESIDAFLMLR